MSARVINNPTFEICHQGLFAHSLFYLYLLVRSKHMLDNKGVSELEHKLIRKKVIIIKY